MFPECSLIVDVVVELWMCTGRFPFCVSFPPFHVISKLHVIHIFSFFLFKYGFLGILKDIVCWDFVIFVKGGFLGDLGDFMVFGHLLAPCVGVLLLGNPCYIFTPALGHMD
jgi:hypothetical protein